MTIQERCRAQAENMDSEGWYVVANVLRAAADEIDNLLEPKESANDPHRSPQSR